MAKDILDGNWKPYTGNILQHWPKVRNADLLAADGKRDRLAAILKERYHITIEEAELQIQDFEARYEHL